MHTGGSRLFIGAGVQDEEPTWATLGRTLSDRPRFVPSTSESRKIAASSQAEPSGVVVGGWTFLVVILVVGLAIVVRRLLRGSTVLGTNDAIRVLARRALAPKQDLFLIGVGPRVLLIGATRDRFTTLSEFHRTDELGLARSETQSSAPMRARSAEPQTVSPYGDVASDLAEIRRTIEGWRT